MQNIEYQVSLKVILKKADKILALQEKTGSFAGFFDLPGGRIHEGETLTPFTKIIKRELQEELGDVQYKLHPKPFAVGRHVTSGSISRSGKDVAILYLFFEAEYLNGDVKISDEHDGMKWIDLKNPEKFFKSGILDGVEQYKGKAKK